MRAGVALGSNLGDRLAQLRRARRAIEKLPGVSRAILASALYETDPVGCEPDAAKFLNAAIEFQYDGEAQDLLRELAAIEAAYGRPERHPKNSSRTVDLDLLYFGDTELETAELQLPHPRLAERAFVLRPLSEIRPDLILPKQDASVKELLARLPDAPAVVRRDLKW